MNDCNAKALLTGTSIDLDPSPLHISQVVPTYFPNHVESVVNTRWVGQVEPGLAALGFSARLKLIL